MCLDFESTMFPYIVPSGDLSHKCVLCVTQLFTRTEWLKRNTRMEPHSAACLYRGVAFTCVLRPE